MSSFVQGSGENEELNDLYSAPNIVRVIKSRRMRRAGHVASVGERRGIYIFVCIIPVVCVTNKEGGVVKQHTVNRG